MMERTVATTFHVDVYCEVENPDKNFEVCGWEGKIVCNANVEPELDGCFNFEWVCPQCHATVQENRDAEDLPDFMKMFFN